MALLIVRNIVKDYTVILFTIVVGAVAGGAIETILDYISTVLSNIVILIISKVLYNIIVTVKQFIVMELTI